MTWDELVAKIDEQLLEATRQLAEAKQRKVNVGDTVICWRMIDYYEAIVTRVFADDAFEVQPIKGFFKRKRFVDGAFVHKQLKKENKNEPSG